MGDSTLRYQGRLCVLNVDGLRERIRTEAHTSRYSMHPDSSKEIFHDLKKVYWWSDMKRNVADFVARCPNYQQVSGLCGKMSELSTSEAEHQRPAFHPQTDGKAKRTIQTLEDMLRACVLDFKGSWDDHLTLIEFAPFEALYGRRCRSPIEWFEIDETELIGPYLVHQAMEKVKIIKE
ncbi:uncharacterized protein [Nicotiana tomentosiformis]|uniref:uncharacterized protein n=1 Tax=Nicotiana tomentosiformis TaxID=4098 RepID=UPI00388C5541